MITLLVPVVDTQRHVGSIARLCVERGGYRPGALGADAKEAVYHAWSAAQRRCGHAPWPLRDHHVSLEVGGAFTGFDGGSLGLAAAVAFVALWTDQVPDGGVCVSAGIEPGGRTLRVEGLPTKRVACHPRPLVVHSDDVDAVGDLGAACLDDAFVHLGIEAPAHLVPQVGRREARRLLYELVDDIEHQAVASYAGQGQSAWSVMAHLAEHYLAAVSPTPSLSVDLHQARAMIALAHTHAGDLHAAQRALEGSATDAPRFAALRAMLQLNKGIDEPDAALHSLDDHLVTCMQQVPSCDRDRLVGVVCGTRGRARLHRHDAGSGLPLLQTALRWHAEHTPHEQARSGIYVAMAQRELGHLDDAQQALVQARADLEAHTRPDYPQLARTTMAYLLYEEARLHLAAGDPRQAARCCQFAAGICEQLALSPWPLAGILRTWAWADPPRADGRRARLQALVGGSDHPVFVQILAEAHGPPDAGTAVY